MFNLFGGLFETPIKRKFIVHFEDETVEAWDFFFGHLPPVGTVLQLEVHKRCLEEEKWDRMEFDADGYVRERYKVTGINMTSRIRPGKDDEEAIVRYPTREIEAVVDLTPLGEGKPQHLTVVG